MFLLLFCVFSGHQDLGSDAAAPPVMPTYAQALPLPVLAPLRDEDVQVIEPRDPEEVIYTGADPPAVAAALDAEDVADPWLEDAPGRDDYMPYVPPVPELRLEEKPISDSEAVRPPEKEEILWSAPSSSSSSSTSMPRLARRNRGSRTPSPVSEWESSPPASASRSHRHEVILVEFTIPASDISTTETPGVVRVTGCFFKDVFLGDMKLKGYTIDTGAASNLSGDAPLKRFLTWLIGKYGPDAPAVRRKPSSCSFTGIAGALQVEEEWYCPGFVGQGLGVIEYRAHIIKDSEIPPLMSLPCLRALKGVLDCVNDCLYLPSIEDRTKMVKLPLHFTGCHYVLPMDLVEESYETPMVQYSVKVEEVKTGAGEKAGVSKTMTWEQAADQQDIASGLPHGPGLNRAARRGILHRGRRARSASPVRVMAFDDGVQLEVNSSTASAARSREYYKNPFRKAGADVLRGRAEELAKVDPIVKLKQAHLEEERPVVVPEPLDVSGIDVWLLLAHDPDFNKECEAAGLKIGPEISWRTGWDLSNDEHWAVFQKMLEKAKPRFVILNPDIPFWSLPPKREDGGDWKLLDRIESLGKFQLMAHNFFSVVRPARDLWWKTPHWNLFSNTDHMEENQTIDCCMHGLRDPESGSPMKFRLTTGGNYAWGSSVARVCTGHGRAQHQRVTGCLKSGETRASVCRTWPEKLCKAMAQDLAGRLLDKAATGPPQQQAGEPRGRKQGLASSTAINVEEVLHNFTRQLEVISENLVAASLRRQAGDSSDEQVSTDEDCDTEELPVFAGERAPYTKTTCKGCLNPKKHKKHSEDNGCKLFRHKEAMKRSAAKRKGAHQKETVARLKSSGAKPMGAELREFLDEGVDEAGFGIGPPLPEDETFGQATAATGVRSASSTEEFGPELGAPTALDDKGDGVELDRKKAIRIPVGLPPGGLTRALMKGGKVAAQATLELHRRHYHERAPVLQKAFAQAGVPQEVIDAVPEILKACDMCKDRAPLPPRAVVSLRFDSRPNGTLHVDLLFIRLFVEHSGVETEDGMIPDVTVMHMLDEATRFRIGVELPGKSESSLRGGLFIWMSVFGFPHRLECDEESGMCSEGMKAWLESNGTELCPNPASSTSRHTASGLIESENRVYRNIARRVDGYVIQLRIPGSDNKMVLTIANWCCNRDLDQADSSPGMRMLGHMPRDLLNTGRLTASQYAAPSYLDRVNVMSWSLAAYQQLRMQERLNRAGRSYARTGAAETGPKQDIEPGDEVDLWRTPLQKDLIGWRGPARCVNSLDKEHGKLGVVWGGRYFSVPTDQIRPHWTEVFLAMGALMATRAAPFPSRAVSAVVLLMGMVDARPDNKPVIFGQVPSQRDGELVLSRAARMEPAVWAAVQRAASSLDLPANGAMLALGAPFLPPMMQVEGAGLLLTWPRAMHARYEFRELRPHWSTNMSRILGDSLDAANYGAIFFYSYEVQRMTYPGEGVSLSGHWDPPRPVRTSPVPNATPSAPTADSPPPPPPSSSAEKPKQAEKSKDSSDYWRGWRMYAKGWRVPESFQDDEEETVAPGTTSARSPAAAPAVPDEAVPVDDDTPGPNATPEEVWEWASARSHSTGLGEELDIDSLQALLSKRDPTAFPEGFVGLSRASSSSSSSAPKGKRASSELTRDEEVKYHELVWDAKLKEVKSQVDHTSFRPIKREVLEYKVMGGRWVLTWKIETILPDGTVKYKVKARLVCKGFGDSQRWALEVFSPTAARLAQRVLVTVAAMNKWHLRSLDVSTAFIQGQSLAEAKTSTGATRHAACTVPHDVWQLLAELGQWRPPHGEEDSWVWQLLKALYGLNDAPKLWLEEVLAFLLSLGFSGSYFDDCVLYLRSQDGGKTVAFGAKWGELILMVTVHVDDIGMTGVLPWLEWLCTMLQGRYGKATVQKDSFLHIGHLYRQDSDFSVTTDLRHFIKDIEEPKVHSNLSLALTDDGMSDLRSVCGSMGYVSAERPDRAGSIAMSQRTMNAEATYRDLKDAVNVLRELKATNHLQLWYPCLVGVPLRLTIAGDAALRNVEEKYPQQGYLALLEDASTEVGGLALPTDFGTRKGGRVSPSSFKAELLNTSLICEHGQKMLRWFAEIAEGAESAMTLQARKNIFPLRLWTDAYDVFSAVRCPRAYSGRDPSCHLFVEGLKEDMRLGYLDELGWCPTGSMIADALTKRMKDTLITLFMQTGRWRPEGYELLHRDDLPKPVGTNTKKYLDEGAGEVKESYHVYLADRAEGSFFWACSPGCVNCIWAVSRQLEVQKLLERDTPLGDFFVDKETEIFLGLRGSTSPRVAGRPEAALRQSARETALMGPTPSAAQVALSEVYLSYFSC